MALHRVVVGAIALATLALTATAIPSATAATPTLAHQTVTGVHNAYNPADYPFLAQALDAGTGMIELDTWTDVFTQEWKVSHDSPTSNTNNCVNASKPADLYTGGANKDLGSCLDDVRVWLAAHPAAGPLFIKVELKNGFEANLGMGPAQFDSVVSAHLGSALFRPANLLGGSFATPDAAARADAWPTRAQLAGKAVVYVIPGTVELANPFDHLHTDVEYATYLKNLAAAGKITQATTSRACSALCPATRAPSTATPRSGRGSCSSTATPPPTPAASTRRSTTPTTTSSR